MKENVDWDRQIKIKSMLARHRQVYEKMFSMIDCENNKSVKILLAFFGSQYYYETLKRLHPHFEAYVIDDIHFKFAYNNIDVEHLVFINIDECTRKNGKGVFFENEANKIFKLKFDYIFMNPPYDKNLHLKIVEQSIPMLSDDGILVNLSPIRWLQDPLAKYKKGSDLNRFKESVAKHLIDLHIVTALESQQKFDGIVSSQDLGIQTYRKINSDFYESIIDPLVKKIVDIHVKHLCTIDENKYDGWRVRIAKVSNTISGGEGKNRKVGLHNLGKLICFYNGTREGKPWYEFFNRNQWSKNTKELTDSISFKNECCANNFIKVFDTVFGKYVEHNLITDINIHSINILWLGNIENPRTHKMGYESDWTNEDLCKVFGITGFISGTKAEKGSEWETILETMKPYL